MTKQVVKFLVEETFVLVWDKYQLLGAPDNPIVTEPVYLTGVKVKVTGTEVPGSAYKQEGPEIETFDWGITVIWTFCCCVIEPEIAVIPRVAYTVVSLVTVPVPVWTRRVTLLEDPALVKITIFCELPFPPMKPNEVSYNVPETTAQDKVMVPVNEPTDVNVTV